MLVANRLNFVAYGLRYNVIVYSSRIGLYFTPIALQRALLNVCKIWFASMLSNCVMKASESFVQTMPPREHSESFTTSLILVISQFPPKSL